MVIVWKDGFRQNLVLLQKSEGDEKSQNNYWEKRVLVCLTKEFLKEENK